MIGPDRPSDDQTPVAAKRRWQPRGLISKGLELLRPPQGATHPEWQCDLVEALATAISACDQTSPGHLRRVKQSAGELARDLGMSEQGIQGVELAALLHDIGKLAIPEHILAKPGPLTQAEFHKVRAHPVVGATIIKDVPFPYPVMPILLSYRERWDGRGYPAGLKGDHIPLGARVLAVADYFDTLVSDRPFRTAKSQGEALGLLRYERGRALDPQVVDVFLARHPQPAETMELTDEQEGAHANAFRDIALAHRELYPLFDIAHALGSSIGLSNVMAKLSSGLPHLMPVSCCALYLQQEDDVLRCILATGVEAGEFQKLTMPVGDGLAGWVARHRRPLVNAAPAVDFKAARSSSQTGLKSALVCPLIVNERLIGVLSVYHTGEASYTFDHLRLLDRVSDQAAVVIANSLAFERAQEESLHDALTGLPNARYMQAHAAHELARAERLRCETSVIVLDLDQFRTLNDSHGRDIGDRALRETADAIRACLQPYDQCGRWFSDKFVVVLTTAGHSVGEQQRQALQHAVGQLRLPAPADPVRLSVSAGLAVFPDDGATWPELLDVAYDRMRDEKRRPDVSG